MLDKGRATLAGKNSEYHYNCTADQHLVKFLGFDPDAFFAEELGRLSKTREDVKTWFEFGELDDYVSFGRKA